MDDPLKALWLDTLPYVVRLAIIVLLGFLASQTRKGVHQWRTTAVQIEQERTKEARLILRYQDSVRPALEIRRDSLRAWRLANPYQGHPDTHRGRK